MRRSSLLLATAASLIAVGYAQAQGADTVEPGAEINATLSKPIDTYRADVGDEITARVTKDVFSHGRVVIPAGSRLVGEITHVWRRASARKKDDDSASDLAAKIAASGRAASEVGFVFEKAVLSDGREIPLNATLRALGSTSAGRPNRLGEVRNTPDGFDASIGTAYGSLAEPRSHGATGGLEDDGTFTPGSRGVFGIRGVQITPGIVGSAGETIIASGARNLTLERGTHLLLVEND